MKKTYRVVVFSILILSSANLIGFPASKVRAEGGLESLQTKVGDNLQYSRDAHTKKITLISAGREGSLPLQISPLKLLLKSLNIFKPGPEKIAQQVIKEYGAYFGLQNPLKESKLGKTTTDKKDNKHIRYNQIYNGVPVFGGQVIVHLKKDLSVKSANGRAVPNVSFNTSPKISQEEAIAKAREIWKEQFGLNEAKVIKAELYILNKSLIDPRFEDKNYLVWQIELRNKKAIKDKSYFINAHTRELVYQLTNIKNITTTTTLTPSPVPIDRSIWDASPALWIGDWSLDRYYCSPIPSVLCPTTYGEYCYTYGRSEGEPTRGTNLWYCNTDVDDLYDIANTCHNFVYDKFEIDGANKYGGIGDGSTEELTTTRIKAYLDDQIYIAGEDPFSCPNAYSADYELGFCYGMVVTDVVAHEYGHSILEFAVHDIPYTSESGAFHECYADITGEAVEYYDTGSNDWINGGDIVLVDIGEGRNLANPTSSSSSLGNRPDKYFSSNFYCGSSDNYGVHHNSTVISHAAYLMAMGGTQTGCTVTAIGRAKQEQIFYQAITNYIVTLTNFNQVYDALLLACDDLYESAYCTEVKRAAQAVEIDQNQDENEDKITGPCGGETETPPDCAADQFPDVGSGHTFYSYIQNLGYGEVVSGYSDGYFRPENNVTRGQMAKFIKNGFGFTTDTSCDPFPDVAEGNTFYDYIMTLKCNDVISGYSDGTFRPGINVTRGQAMKFVINGAREKQNDPTFLPINDPPPTFPDVPVGHTFYDHIMAAYSNDIVSGYGDGYFKPSNTTTRGQMSKMVDNTRDKIYFPD